MDEESLYIKSWAEFFGDCFEVIGLGSLKVLFNFIKGQKNKKLYNRFIDNRKNYFGNATDEEIDKYLKSLATEIKALKNQSFLTTLKNKFKGKKGINQFLFTTDIYKADDFKQILEKCSTFNNYEPFQNGMLNLFEDTVEYARKHAFEDLSDENKAGFSLVISEVRSSEKRLNEEIEQLETIGQIVHNYSKDKAEEKTHKYTHHKCFYCGHTGSHLIWPKNNNKSDQKTIFCCACGHSYDVRVDNYTEEERKLLEEVFNEKISKLATKKDIEELLEQNRDLEEQYKNFLLNFQKTILNIFEQERQDNMSSLKDLKDKIQEQLDKCIQCIQELTKKIDNQSDKIEEIDEILKKINNLIQENKTVTIEKIKSVKAEVIRTSTIVENHLNLQDIIYQIKDSLLYKIMENCFNKNDIYLGKLQLNFCDDMFRQKFLLELNTNYQKYNDVYQYILLEKTNYNAIRSDQVIGILEIVQNFAGCWGKESTDGNPDSILLRKFLSFCSKLSTSNSESDNKKVEIESESNKKVEPIPRVSSNLKSCPICTNEEIENNICKFCKFDLDGDEVKDMANKFQDKDYKNCNNNQFLIINGTLKSVFNPKRIQFIPQGVTHIDCSALCYDRIIKLFIPKTLKYFVTNGIDIKKFLENCLIINFEKNSEIKTIPAHLFEFKYNLKIINFPENVCHFEEYAFYGCYQLMEVLQSFFEKKYPLEKDKVQNIVTQIIYEGKEWSYEKN